MGENSFFKFFAGILILAMMIFGFMNSRFEFECPLPKGGYYKIKWIKESNRFDVFYWQPKKQVKPLPKNNIYIEGTPKVKPEKPQF
ncbi:MAG: hypothetical protein KKD05_03785 [Candidatus Omnitrophica bacterium]|nr:hypothetical protein [Candidatus Omnitrophota bacterium]